MDNLDVKKTSEFKHFTKSIPIDSNKRLQADQLKYFLYIRSQFYIKILIFRLKDKCTVYGKVPLSGLDETHSLTLPYYLRMDKFGQNI